MSFKRIAKTTLAGASAFMLAGAFWFRFIAPEDSIRWAMPTFTRLMCSVYQGTLHEDLSCTTIDPFILGLFACLLAWIALTIVKYERA